MKYKIIWIEERNSASGKLYAKATIQSEEGKTYDNVTIFGDYPNFKDLRPESHTEGELKEGEYQGKKSYTLNPAMIRNPHMMKDGAAKKNLMASVMKEKSESIEKAQERKSDAIREAAIFRDTTLITVAVLNALVAKGENFERENVEEEWSRWREWLTSKYDQPF